MCGAPFTAAIRKQCRVTELYCAIREAGRGGGSAERGLGGGIDGGEAVAGAVGDATADDG